jgi:hypothetical protein
MALHGCRRIFGFALMIHGGLGRSELLPYLLARRWLRDFAALTGSTPQEFAERIVSDLEGSGAARWRHDRLVSTVPHSRGAGAGGGREAYPSWPEDGVQPPPAPSNG